MRRIRNLLGRIASFGGWHRRRRASYSELCLLIGKVRQSYFAKVIKAPAGDGRGKVSLPKLRRSLQGGGAARSANDLGGDLFRAVFQGEVRELWVKSLAQTRGRSRLLIKLRLEVDPELLALPWECLYDRDHRNFLALDVETPVVRDLDIQVAPFPEKAPRPTQVLILLANPPGTPHLQIEQEFQKISEALSPLGSRVRIKRLERPSMALLESCLGECHVFHFMGHGELGKLVLEGSDGQPLMVDVQDLAAFFPSRHTIRLVVLNSCQGGLQSAEDAFSGVAQSLVQKGIPAVVAMRHDVGDALAIAFSSTLYQALSQGASIQEAVTLGRKAMLVDKDRDAWATPVLYMRQDLEILPPPRFPWVWLSTIGLLVLLLILGGRWLRQWESAKHCPVPAGVDLHFVKIPPGRFLMGAKRGKGDNTPAHRVILKDAFCLTDTEITQKQWFDVTGSTPSSVSGADRPVEKVSWNDVQDFLAKLNRQDAKGHYRLPTEAQWEYAARGGRDGIFGFGDRIDQLPKHGNCDSEHDLFPKTAGVGSFLPNRWGLYDMHGNVSEWVADWYGPYSGNEQTDPTGPSSGVERVRRGGSWNTNAKNCNAIERNSSPPTYTAGDVGFRIVRDPIR